MHFEAHVQQAAQQVYTPTYVQCKLMTVDNVLRLSVFQSKLWLEEEERVNQQPHKVQRRLTSCSTPKHVCFLPLSVAAALTCVCSVCWEH